MEARTEEHYVAAAMSEMEKSPCVKRKVGAVVVDEFGEIIGRGHNFNLDNGPCEGVNGTIPTVVHAEIVALDDAQALVHKHLLRQSKPHKIYVTHSPCVACFQAIIAAGIKQENVILTNKTVGIKHDNEKLMLSLIPTELIDGVGEVLTFGAKKYGKANWKHIDDPTRYLDALMRHLEAYRGGEEFDGETGLPHMAHIATNVSFLLWFDSERSGWRDEED